MVKETAARSKARAKKINAKHLKARAHMRDAITHALEKGRTLRDANQFNAKQAKPLNWYEWVAGNLPFRARTAERYIKFAKTFDSLPSTFQERILNRAGDVKRAMLLTELAYGCR